MIKVGDEIEIEIEKMANRGKGLARINDQVVFVPYSTPEDALRVKVLKVSKNFIDAEIVQILKPSPMRVTAPCPHYTQCGGCDFQHIDYPKQVEIKDGLVKETLMRALSLTDESLFLAPILSPKIWNYRNRIQIHIENGEFGFNKRLSNKVVPVENCLIAETAINDELRSLKTGKDFQNSEKLELVVDKSLIVHRRDLNSLGQPQLFSQVNRFANEVLVDLVVNKVLAAKPKTKVYDLYSGDGNFLLAISKALPGHECLGIEMNPALVSLGRSQANLLKLRAKFIPSSVEKYFESVLFDSTDVLILDPPRTGCDSNTMLILGSSPRNRVIYVSCEPTTLARDLRVLKDTAGKWGLTLNFKSVQTIDMFPQTEHIETVVEFSIDKIDTTKTTH